MNEPSKVQTDSEKCLARTLLNSSSSPPSPSTPTGHLPLSASEKLESKAPLNPDGAHAEAKASTISSNPSTTGPDATGRTPTTRFNTYTNIEETPVHDDPRKWSNVRKNFTLATVSCASLLLTLAISIYNPALNDLIADLHSDFKTISWTLSANALVTGITPLAWGAFTELYGRKTIYLFSISLFILGSGIAGAAKSIGVLIAMRIVQGIGGSAVLTIGAATLADIYPPSSRGRMMGIYYAAPLLGPSLGPLIGGIITKVFSWRATFYFLAIFGGASLVSFVFFKDTFRRERSLAWTAAHRKAVAEQAGRVRKGAVDEKRISEAAASRRTGMPATTTVTPVPTTTTTTATATAATELSPANTVDIEAGSKIKSVKPVYDAHEADPKVRVRIRHMQTFQPMIQVIRRPNNLCVLGASAIMFGGITYCLPFTAVRTFGLPPYNYNSLQIGSVLLAFGMGNVVGSLLGGRWSDRIRRRLQAKNDGVSQSEHRLHSTIPLMPLLVGGLVAYAWMADKKVHIAGICVVLFAVGFSSIWIYTSLLAYMVDANTGRSSSAVSVNSFCRNLMAFTAAEIAIPLQDALGDGGLYTLMAGAMLLECALILAVAYRGTAWREAAERRERVRQ